MQNRIALTSMLAMAAFAMITGCSDERAAVPVQAPAPAISSGATVELPSFVTLVKEVGPAVVNVSTIRTIRETVEAVPNISPDDPMFEFFRRFMPPPDAREFQARGLGSGFIISPDGYILTNAHVVADTNEAIVRLTTKKEFKAKIIGTDPRTDVALLKIDARDLPFVKIGDPGKLEVGEWVAAIGAPFGFENSVTSGIVSAKERSLPDETYVPFIQSDVALNPGNSGGPLFNMRGEVVGINSQIYSQSGGYMGLSFAIPIDLAIDISKQLQATGKVSRGRMGVQAQELTADLAASFGVKDVRGALVVMLEAGGPAHKAGIQPGDVIRSFDGKPIQGPAELARLVAGTKPGTTVTLDVWRKGVSKPVKVAIAEQAQERVATGPDGAAEASSSQTGLVLSELSSAQRAKLGIDAGLLVRRATGPAQRAGIEPGDVILAVNNAPAKSLADFEAQITANQGKSVALLVRRNDDAIYVPLQLSAR